jgi:hypothetical protein
MKAQSRQTNHRHALACVHPEGHALLTATSRENVVPGSCATRKPARKNSRVPLRTTMLSVYRSTAHVPPPTGFKSVQEASSSSIKGTHRAVHAGLALDAGVTCPVTVGGRRGTRTPAGILGLCVPGARHRLSNPDRRASVPKSGVRNGLQICDPSRMRSSLVRGASTGFRHKGGAGLLGDRLIEGDDAEPCREAVQWRKRRLVR